MRVHAAKPQGHKNALIKYTARVESSYLRSQERAHPEDKFVLGMQRFE